MGHWFGFLAIALLATFGLAADIARAPKIPVHTWNLTPWTWAGRGYAMGYVTSANQVWNAPWWTGEAKLQLGLNSSNAGPTTDAECLDDLSRALAKISDPKALKQIQDAGAVNCQGPVNPWPFSTFSSTMLERLKGLQQTHPVLIYYGRWIYYPLTDTNNIIHNVWNINPDRPLPRTSMNNEGRYWVADWIHVVKGQVEGRFVRAEVDNLIRQNYLITMQEGQSGNTFDRFNVSGTDMFRFIVQIMSANRAVKVQFFRVFDWFQTINGLYTGYKTDRRIYQIDVID